MGIKIWLWSFPVVPQFNQNCISFFLMNKGIIFPCSFVSLLCMFDVQIYLRIVVICKIWLMIIKSCGKLQASKMMIMEWGCDNQSQTNVIGWVILSDVELKSGLQDIHKTLISLFLSSTVSIFFLSEEWGVGDPNKIKYYIYRQINILRNDHKKRKILKQKKER